MLKVPDTIVTPYSRENNWLLEHPAPFPPNSVSFNAEFIDAMQGFDKQWKQEEGINWLFGEEIEFTFTEKNKPIQNQAHKKDLLDELTEHFSAQLHTDMSSRKVAEIEDKIEALEEFSLSELVMCKLHEIILPDMLEYRFGTGSLGEGYYDFPPVLEVRVAKQPAEQAVANYNQTVATIRNIAEQYDLSPRFYRHHVNFSANRASDGKNLTQINDEESLEFSSKVAEGVNHAFEEAFPLTEDSWANDSYNVTPRIGLDRKSRLRVCDNRLEFRGAHAEDNTNLAMELALILGGARYGHECTSVDYHNTLYPPSRTVQGIKVSNPLHPEFKATKKVLASARRSKDGKLFIPENVLELYLSYLKEEHGLDHLDDAEALEVLDGRFNKIRINDDKTLDFSFIHDVDWQSLLGEFSCDRFFATIENDGYRHKGGYKHGTENVQRMDASKSLREILGDRLIDAMTKASSEQAQMNNIIGELVNKYRPKLKQSASGRVLGDVAEQFATELKSIARQEIPSLQGEVLGQAAMFVNRVALEPKKAGFEESGRPRLSFFAHELDSISAVEKTI